LFTNYGLYQRESFKYGTCNPLLEDYDKPLNEINEAIATDLRISEVRAIYPLIEAIHSGKLTRNFTYYPSETLQGNRKLGTGYASFVEPYGKPVITEHRFQDSEYGKADPPMGRLIATSFSKRGKDEVLTPAKKGDPGTKEGDGTLTAIAAITDQTSIERVLGNIYHTVSIGSVCNKVVESISGIDLVKAHKEGGEAPSYIRGQIYNGQRSYWSMNDLKGREMSYVNAPSEETAGNRKVDLGLGGVRLLLADKKTGTKEFNFFDAKTGEKIQWSMEECIFDTSYIEDSANVGTNIWWINGTEQHLINHGFDTTESENSVTEPKTTSKIEVGSNVSWGSGVKGKVISLETAKFSLENTTLSFPASEAEPYALIETNGRKVAHKVSLLRMEKL